MGWGFHLMGEHPGREDRPTLRLLTATNLCFAERNVYTSEVLAVVMQQLMEQSPLPMLLMRTVIQSLTMYPRLGGFVMNILARLIMKQVTCPGPRPQWGKSQLPGEQDPVSGSPTLPLAVFPQLLPTDYRVTNENRDQRDVGVSLYRTPRPCGAHSSTESIPSL